MMKRQLELRREETGTLHAYVYPHQPIFLSQQRYRRCDALEAKLKGLRESFQSLKMDTTDETRQGMVRTFRFIPRQFL